MKAAGVDLDALSAKLVLAGSAAKNFDDGAKLDNVLAMCRAAGNAVAAFLATYQMQDRMFDEDGDAVPAAPSAPSPSTSAQMQVDS